jgi:hypothetical protein
MEKKSESFKYAIYTGVTAIKFVFFVCFNNFPISENSS